MSSAESSGHLSPYDCVEGLDKGTPIVSLRSPKIFQVGTSGVLCVKATTAEVLRAFRCIGQIFLNIPGRLPYGDVRCICFAIPYLIPLRSHMVLCLQGLYLVGGSQGLQL